MTLNVDREHLPAVARVLRDDPALRFEICTGVSGCTTPTARARSCTRSTTSCRSRNGGRRVRVEVSCPDGDPHIPSIVSVYGQRGPAQRETWDMFGIEFDGHRRH